MYFFLVLINVVFSKESMRSAVLHFFYHLTSIRRSCSRSIAADVCNKISKSTTTSCSYSRDTFDVFRLLWMYLCNIFCFGPFTISWLSECVTLTARWCFTLQCYKGEHKKITSVAQNSKSFFLFVFLLQGEFCHDTCTQTSTLSQYHLCVFDGHSPQDKNIWRNKKRFPKHFLRHL